jgi:DNA-binding CsgD family transcriptional regulator
MNGLASHVTRALSLHAKMLGLKHAAAATGNVLDGLDVALVGLDAGGKVCFTNAAAESILRSGRLVRLQEGRIVGRGASATAALSQLQKTAAVLDPNAAPKGSLTLRDGECSLYLTALPFRGAHSLFPGTLRLLMTISDPEAQPKSRDQLLVSLFGLTPAEARIAMLLVSGRDPKEIAEETETTQNTVRYQLKAVYRKTGVNRQTQLVRLISVLPGRA